VQNARADRSASRRSSRRARNFARVRDVTFADVVVGLTAVFIVFEDFIREHRYHARAYDSIIERARAKVPGFYIP
jgi:hypothetical protein